MAVPSATKAVVVMGSDGARVAAEVAARRAAGQRVAGFVGDDEAEARAMATEMLGGAGAVVQV
ncbi:MAG TPA: hypothetical protein VM142_04355 [Acidimicrobiales bacterium]|nr:hypothetical protein [Acidimicrobiales bacterium]